MTHASDKSQTVPAVIAKKGARAGSPNPLLVFVRAIRAHQWAKNLLLFVPIAAGHRVQDVGVLASAAIAFAVWCLVASAIYLINDIWDIEADRKHAQKRMRPLASGQMSVTTAVIIATAFLTAAGVIMVRWLPVAFWGWLGAYFALSNLYSFMLKRRLLADVLTLAALYTIRILGGGAATGILISHHLLAFSMFLFASLAFAKRFTELHELAEANELEESEPNTTIEGRAYVKKDLDIVLVVGPSCGYLAILVLMFYLNNIIELATRGARAGGPGAPELLYRHPQYLYLICPLLAYWVTRVWFIANRGHLHHDPLVFALKDPKSYAVGAACLAIVYAATVM